MPRMLLEGLSPEAREAFLEDLNRVMLPHNLAHTTAPFGRHVFTVVDFEHAKIGAEERRKIAKRVK